MAPHHDGASHHNGAPHSDKAIHHDGAPSHNGALHHNQAAGPLRSPKAQPSTQRPNIANPGAEAEEDILERWSCSVLCTWSGCGRPGRAVVVRDGPGGSAGALR